MTSNLTDKLNRFQAFWRHFSGAEAINNILVVCVILYVWNFVSGVIDNPARYLPAPDVVIFSSFDLFHKGLLPVYFGETMARLVTGSFIGLALGIPFGLALGLNKTVSDIFYPILNFFQSVSGIAIFPIIVIWWGNSEKTVLAIILYTAFFPVAFSVLSGVRTVPMRYVQAAQTLGASHWQIVKDVLIPGAMPHIATGSRLSIGFGWRAVIAGEMLAGRQGMGWMIFTGQDADRTHEVILGMVVIGLTWIVLDRYLLRPFEADTIERWGLVQR